MEMDWKQCTLGNETIIRQKYNDRCYVRNPKD